MLRLRRRWTPPPEWPRPPRSFVPPLGWHPHPTWPAAPADWRFWRVPPIRLVAALLLAGLAALTWSGTIDNAHAQRKHTVLDKRGVTTAAVVLTYSYDPDGGDPGGWTTDRIRFTTGNGTVVLSTVGHHDPGREDASGRLAVTYDRQHPTLVRASGYPEDVLDPAIVAAFATLITVAALFAITRVVTRASSG